MQLDRCLLILLDKLRDDSEDYLIILVSPGFHLVHGLSEVSLKVRVDDLHFLKRSLKVLNFMLSVPAPPLSRLLLLESIATFCALF